VYNFKVIEELPKYQVLEETRPIVSCWENNKNFLFIHMEDTL
jgi:hypothetical protein